MLRRTRPDPCPEPDGGRPEAYADGPVSHCLGSSWVARRLLLCQAQERDSGPTARDPVIRRRRQIQLGPGSPCSLRSRPRSPWCPRSCADALARAPPHGRRRRGPIEAAISASGSVLPEVEHVLTSPVDARVLRVRKRGGDAVEPGETILELDLSAARLALEDLDRDLALRRNDERQKRLALGRTSAPRGPRRGDDRTSRRIASALAGRRQLCESGLVSEQELTVAEPRRRRRPSS